MILIPVPPPITPFLSVPSSSCSCALAPFWPSGAIALAIFVVVIAAMSWWACWLTRP